MWIMGEDKDKKPVTLEWIEEWTERKGATFPVMRDYKFMQTYGAVAQESTSLPHQYILDGETMELLYASGGVNDEAEKVKELLDK